MPISEPIQEFLNTTGDLHVGPMCPRSCAIHGTAVDLAGTRKHAGHLRGRGWQVCGLLSMSSRPVNIKRCRAIADHACTVYYPCSRAPRRPWPAMYGIWTTVARCVSMLALGPAARNNVPGQLWSRQVRGQSRTSPGLVLTLVSVESHIVLRHYFWFQLNPKFLFSVDLYLALTVIPNPQFNPCLNPNPNTDLGSKINPNELPHGSRMADY